MTTTLTDRAPTVPPDRPIAGPRRVAGWRAAARFARREITRAKGRAALVLALIAVPVAAMLFAEVLIRSNDLSLRQRDLLQLGRVADVAATYVSVPSPADPRTTMPPSLPAPPAGARVADLTDLDAGSIEITGAFRRVAVHVGDLANPVLRGAYDVVAGTAPLTADEAALSVRAARRFHVAVGDTVTRRSSGQRWRVTGIYQRASNWTEEGIVVAARPAGSADTTVSAVTRWIAYPPDRPVAPLADLGTVDVISRHAPEGPGIDTLRDDRHLVTLLSLYTGGTIALFIAGIVVRAAFAAGARRQLRSLGLAAASGASPRQVRRAVTFQGTTLGVVGTLIGLGIGAVALRIAAPRFNDWAGVVVPGVRTSVTDLVLIVALAIGAATLAALSPAIAAARMSVSTALAGRRPLAPARASAPVVGIALLAVGLVVIGLTVSTGDHTILGGWVRSAGSGTALLLGSVLCMPWLIGRYERLAPRLRGPARLAARSMARGRGRTGPIAAAMLVAVGGAMALATFVSSGYAQRARDFGSFPKDLVRISNLAGSGEAPSTVDPAVINRVRAIVGTDAHVLSIAYATGRTTPMTVWASAPSVPATTGSVPNGWRAAIADEAALRTGGVPDEAIVAWNAGTTLVLGPGFPSGSQLALHLYAPPTAPPAGAVQATFATTASVPGPPATTITTVPPAQEVPARDVMVPALSTTPAVIDPDQSQAITCASNSCERPATPPVFVLAPAVVRSLDLVGEAPTTIVHAVGPITANATAMLSRLRNELFDDAQEAADRGGANIFTSIQFRLQDPDAAPLELVLTAAAAAAALAVVAVGLGLGAAESRSDDLTLVALGAPPLLRRAQRAWEAFFTAAPACLLAVPLGFLPAAVASYFHRRDLPTDPHHAVAFPWRTALGLGVVLPIVAALVFWLCTWPRRAVLLRDD